MSSHRPTSYLEGISDVDDAPSEAAATLWTDVWRKMRRDKRFWVAAAQ
jgi:hypothetical protein